MSAALTDLPQVDSGDPLTGPGSHPPDRAADGVSAVPVSIPIAKIVRRAATTPEITEPEFWQRRATEPCVVLKPLGRPCHDCAVVWGLYSPMTDSLALQPTDVQREASARWSCHNHNNRACRGNIDRLAALAHPLTPQS